MIGIDNTYPTIIFDQLISLGDKYEGVTIQPVEFSENGVIDNLFDRQLDFYNLPTACICTSSGTGKPDYQ
ncbi:putative LYSR-type transcriptional regulator [Escherichia coli]|nr:putative LYSR-type transcriptional regulator [Escherichia coli]